MEVYCLRQDHGHGNLNSPVDNCDPDLKARMAVITWVL
jgi:hypothetical protein